MSLTDLPDRELTGRIAAGDEGAFAACYDRHAARVLGFLVKLLPKREDAEDLLQTTFLEAWRNAHLYDANRSRLDAWLLLIARSRALDYLRRRRIAVEPLDFLDAATSDDPSRDLERGEAAKRLRRAIRELPDEQRQAIRLAFFHGLTHTQISERLELPLGTIKTRIRLAMNQLRNILREQ
jgi:RNA polymerase sigma-70 factor, ECF subfamily